MNDHQPPILCPDCGHNIDAHHEDGEAIIDACWEPEYAYDSEGDSVECLCNCRMKPSDIARALLTAEPTDNEVDAASYAMSSHWRDMHTNEALGYQRMLADHALAAAAKVRADR